MRRAAARIAGKGIRAAGEDAPKQTNNNSTPVKGLRLEWDAISHKIWQAKLGERTFRVFRTINGAEGVVCIEKNRYNHEVRREYAPNVREAKIKVDQWV